MEMNPNRNLTQQVAHALGMGILQGKYRPDQPFPSEAELSEMFNVSRSATREAVKMLTAKGLLSSRPRQGIRILPDTQWNLFDTDVLGWILASRPSMELLRDFIQMRIAIEPEAAALAAAHPDSTEVALIGEALRRMVDAEEGLDDSLESDIAFHTGILLASKNRFFIQLRPFSATALRASIRHTNKLKGVAMASIREHTRVYDAIRKGKAQQARTLMRALIEEALQLIEDRIAAAA